MEEVLRERAKQPENQKTAPTEEIREENKEVEVKVKEARVFFTENRAEVFQRNHAKKGFVKERGFRKPVPPFKEEVEIRG